MHFSIPNMESYLPGSQVFVVCTNPNPYYTGTPYWTGPGGGSIGDMGTLKLMAESRLQGTFTCRFFKNNLLPWTPGSRSFELIVASEFIIRYRLTHTGYNHTNFS